MAGIRLLLINIIYIMRHFNRTVKKPVQKVVRAFALSLAYSV